MGYGRFRIGGFRLFIFRVQPLHAVALQLSRRKFIVPFRRIQIDHLNAHGLILNLKSFLHALYQLMVRSQNLAAVQQQLDFAGKILSAEPVLDLLHQVHFSSFPSSVLESDRGRRPQCGLRWIRFCRQKT